MKYKLTFIIIIIFTLTNLFQSCGLDLIESKYPDYYTAKNDGLINKGWIPDKIIFESMTNIYQKTDVDLNTCVFSYSLSKADLEMVINNIQLRQVQNKILPRINPPKWWIKKVTSLNHYYFVNDNNHDTIYIAIDKLDNKIFGWRN
jgi:hypothetical protein